MLTLNRLECYVLSWIALCSSCTSLRSERVANVRHAAFLSQPPLGRPRTWMYFHILSNLRESQRIYRCAEHTYIYCTMRIIWAAMCRLFVFAKQKISWVTTRATHKSQTTCVLFIQILHPFVICSRLCVLVCLCFSFFRFLNEYMLRILICIIKIDCVYEYQNVRT